MQTSPTVPDPADSILIVEDDEFAREALEALLREHGYTVIGARDGAEAFEQIERETPALIISDVRMPGMDGFALVDRLRKHPSTSDIPVILLTALDKREHFIQGLDLGADDFVAKPADPDELLARVRVHLRHSHRARVLVRRSLLDPLTGTLNRRGIMAVLRRERERAERTGAPLSVLMLDVDGFKELNDTFGHATGDAVLRQIARAIVETVRVVDHVGRIGGDEFVVAVPDGDEAAAGALAARLSVLQLPPLEVAGHELQVHVSVGTATLAPGESVDALVGRADAAMYAHKTRRPRLPTGPRAAAH